VETPKYGASRRKEASSNTKTAKPVIKHVIYSMYFILLQPPKQIFEKSQGRRHLCPLSYVIYVISPGRTLYFSLFSSHSPNLTSPIRNPKFRPLTSDLRPLIFLDPSPQLSSEHPYSLTLREYRLKLTIVQWMISKHSGITTDDRTALQSPCSVS
jgi:hypothetical protein